ncbi:hypothetical protein PRIPAC_96891 [Pristionchus pacificus]|nr:hypothetical protein PRIPAC_96891 [Pristionchus pacificus]
MLFDTALIVSISRSQNDDGTYKHSPDITYCFGEFPANSSKCITNIGSIIYPDIQHVTKLRRGKHTVDSCDHSFFVAFTDEMGVRTYAYCVKFEPTYSETEPYYFPSVFAILARTRDPSFYFELAKRALAHISDRTRLSNFLSTVHPQEHPRNGGMLIVMERNDIGSYGKRSEIHCSFGCDKKMKAGWSVNDLVRQLHPEWVVAIIAACLAEQRVLITGNNVHDVSRAVNAIDALLRPLEWPFTFVPVLPDSILEICDVPAPYLMGVLRHNLDKLHHLVIEDLGKDEAKNQTDFVLFDIDRGLVNPIPFTIKNNKHFEENEFGRFRNMNEVERETYLRRKNTLSYCKSMGMPRKVAKSLIDHLKGALEREKSDYDIETCTEAMLTWYSTVFGHIKSSGAFSNWDKTAKMRLVEKQPHPATREFLELLVETTVFDIWIQRRIKSDGRIILPSEELEIIDVIFLKFCDEFDYKRKKPVKAAFKQLFGRN